MQKSGTRTFQGLILTLQGYWAHQDCTIVQPLGMEVSTGASRPMTCLRALEPKPMAAAYVQPSRRPTGGRYSENPNRLQYYYQLQVVIKSSSGNIQELYPGSLEKLSMDPTIHDIRFAEDNWENLTLGAWSLGWEIWLNGMEATQFTYFQQMDDLECKPVTGEITYGLERLAMCIQDVNSVYDLVWSNGPLSKTTYDDVFHRNGVEQSTYNFEHADVDLLFSCFEQYKKEAQQLLALETPLPLPAYEHTLKTAHSFNLLGTRKTVSITGRQHCILHIHTLTKAVTETYYASREALGFPMCNKNK